MSVIIQGMKLPKGCDSCELVQDYDEDSVCCPFLRNESWYGAAPDYRLEHCPLIGIPTPHGRLIDADKLTKNMRNYYPSIDHLCCSQHVVTKGDIDNAPTVIEAEHESEARKWARVGRDISKGLQEGIEAINSEEIEE